MITKLTIKTAPAETTEALLEVAKAHPLFQGSTSVISPSGCSTFTISYGKSGLEFVRFTFSRHAAGPIVLTTVKGNLPALLWGHEGCRIQNQFELELGLSRLRWFGSGLVKGADADFLLPHVSKANTGYITELGLAVQIFDVDGKLFDAGRFSTVNGSGEPPVLEAGHTTLPGRSVTWDFRHVKNGFTSPNQAPWTRLECYIRDSDLLAKGVRIKYPGRYFLAALPYGDLLALFKRAAKETLGGGLSVPTPHNYSVEFAHAVSRVTRQSYHPTPLHLALQIEQIGMPAERAAKLRRRVFREMSMTHKPCLEEILADQALDGRYCEAPDAEIEVKHVEMMKTLGCPESADEPTSETFCGHLLRARWDPHQRLFFNLEDGLPY